MPDLGAVYGEGNWRRSLALGGAVAFLLAGLLAVTAGGAKLLTSFIVGLGVPETPARQIAIATAATLPPVVLGAILATVQPSRRLQIFGLAGVAVALAGVATGLPLGFDDAAVLVGLVYGAGLLLVVASLVQGVLAGHEDAAETSSTAWAPGSTSSMYRSSRSDAMPADGGEAEDGDLTFLLEDESEDDR